jgi:tumor protein p53-inducible protein 3
MGGPIVKEFNLSKFLGKRIQLTFTTLRSRSDNYKSELISKFSNEILPGFKTLEFKPVIDSIYNAEQIKEAHQRMESNQNIGKIVVKWI